MLKLQLNCGADVFIGNTIKVVVRKIDAANNSVELGFYAPKEVKILRGSLLRNSRKREKPNFQTDKDNLNVNNSDGTAHGT